jgi:signal peptidase II
MTQARSKLVTPIVAVLCFLADAASKQWARQTLTDSLDQQFIPGFIHFKLTANTGAAFSLGRDNPFIMTALAASLTLALIAWAVLRERKSEPQPTIDRVAMGCLLAGAMGNLFDRFVRGRVTDFLEFSFVSFPVFNLADVLIDTGIGLLIISSLIHKPDAKSSAPESDSSSGSAKGQ